MFVVRFKSELDSQICSSVLLKKLLIYFSFLLCNCQEKQTDNSSKQLESTQSQQESPAPTHSVVLKKKDRTPEEGSKAIYKMAVIAAIGSTRATCSTTSTPKSHTNSMSLPFVSSPVKTETPCPASPDTTEENSDCFLTTPEDKCSDNNTVQDDQWSHIYVCEDTDAQGDNSELITDRRVSQLTQRNLFFSCSLLIYNARCFLFHVKVFVICFLSI